MTHNQEYSWPMDFPEGTPPEDAKPATGKVFRLVKNLPPKEEDFLSTRKEKHYTHRKQSKSNEALTYGVSLWNDKNELTKVIERYPSPEQLGGRFIAYGELKPILGKISHTFGKGHITLWKQQDAKPHLYINKEAS